MRRRTLLCGLAALPAAARAAEWPTHPVRIVVPFAPGGSGDITARLLANYLETRLPQPVVIENKPGANGVIGTMAVKQAAADGHTVLLATTSTLAANPSLVRDLPYDPERDFIPVGIFGSGGNYILVRPDAPWRDLAALIADAKARPGMIHFGHFNASSRVPGELLNAVAGVQMVGVPYRTIGAAFADLLGRRIQVIHVDTTAGDAFLRNGECRALAHTRAGRWDRHPEIPPAEATVPGFVITGFLGIAVAAGTPAEVQARLNALTNAAIMAEPMRGRLEAFGYTPVPRDLAGVAAEIRSERAKWAGFVRQAGIEPE